MTDLDFKTIGLKIKERRVSQCVTQECIANHLDVNPSHISNIECGRANPSLTALVKIANILECSIDYFISGEYTFQIRNECSDSIENEIHAKLKHCSLEKKKKISKIIDIL